MKEALRLQGVTADPGGGGAVAGVDLVVLPGEVVGLVGDLERVRTVGRLAAGVLEPMAGQVFIDGLPARGRNVHALRRAAYLEPQSITRSAGGLGSLYGSLYPTWSEGRFDELRARLKVSRHMPMIHRNAGAVTGVAAVGLSTGAGAVLIHEPLPVGVTKLPARGTDEQRRGVLTAIVSAARDCGCALVLGHSDEAELEDHVDRIVRVEAPVGPPAPSPSPSPSGVARVSSAADPGQVLTLVNHGLRPNLMGLIELPWIVGAFWIVWLSSGDDGLAASIVFPLLGFALLAMWLAGFWSPVSALGDGLSGAWGNLGGGLPISSATSISSRLLVALGRSIVPLMPVVYGALVLNHAWALEGLPWLFAFAEPLGCSLIFALLALAPLTPVVAGARLISPGRTRYAVQIAGFAVAAASAGFFGADQWMSPRLWGAAITQPIVLGLVALGAALGFGWLVHGLPRHALGSIRGRRTWSPLLVASALALCAALPAAVLSGIPEPDWRDVQFPGISVLDADLLLVDSPKPDVNQPPGVADLTFVNWRTWETTELPQDVLGLVRAGDLWGRLMGTGEERWLELAATPKGPAVAESPRWQRKTWGPTWNEETGLLSGSGSESDRLWLEPSGRGGVLSSDERIRGRWRIVRGASGVPEFEVLPPRDKRTCPDGSAPVWGWSVLRCDEPGGYALYWHDDDDPTTPARVLPALPPGLEGSSLRKLLPIGLDRFAFYSALGPATVLTLDGRGGWLEPVSLDVPTTMVVKPIGADMLLVEMNVGPRVSDVLRVCSATTGRCSAPPAR